MFFALPSFLPFRVFRAFRGESFRMRRATSGRGFPGRAWSRSADPGSGNAEKTALQLNTMSEHRIELNWKRTSPDFDYRSYNRDHAVTFKNGEALGMSAAPAYKGSPELVDPEELLVASLSSCHMLTFLALAAKKGLVVDSYHDDAVGVLEKNEDGKLAITRVTLRPRVIFAGEPVDAATLDEFHHHAHEECFIASSVKTKVEVE